MKSCSIVVTAFLSVVGALSSLPSLVHGKERSDRDMTLSKTSGSENKKNTIGHFKKRTEETSDPMNPFGRALMSRGGSKDGDCGECPFDVFYYYESIKDPSFLSAVSGSPNDCVLAAIRDEESRRGAQYAIPPGAIAITQGYFEIDDYIHDCQFDDEKTVNGTVTGCENPYQEYFANYEDSSVPYDAHCWVDIDFPIPDGAIFAAIGADGLLRPVIQWSSDVDNFGYTGAVYECCPDIDDICEIRPAY